MGLLSRGVQREFSPGIRIATQSRGQSPHFGLRGFHRKIAIAISIAIPPRPEMSMGSFRAGHCETPLHTSFRQAFSQVSFSDEGYRNRNRNRNSQFRAAGWVGLVGLVWLSWLSLA